MRRTIVHLSCAFVALAAATPIASVAQAPTCRQEPGPRCLYVPATDHGFTLLERTMSYTDVAGDRRELRFLVRRPTGAAVPMPVVLWSHGGADGKDSPATSMVEWSEASARAGYLAISIAHAHRGPASRRRLCAAVGIADDPTCTIFKYLNWDRPHDIRAVLDELERTAAGEWRGQVDLQRIAVGGHSAGAGGTQSIAGAKRRIVDAPIDLSDPRPVAFLAFSPQQPGSEGFFDTRFGDDRHSWTDVHRPMLVATGDGDNTADPGSEPGSLVGDLPFGRRIGFQRMSADGNKYALYLHDANAFHTLFELNAAKCVLPGVDPRRCTESIRWLTSAGLAFLDAYLRELPAAREWLDSDRVEIASEGVAEWQRK